MSRLLDVSKDEFLAAAKMGDCGLTKGGGMLGWFENLKRKKEHEGAVLMTHVFACKGNGKISEADGKSVVESDLSRYIGGKRHTVIFRFKNITDDQRNIMSAYIAGTEKVRGQYAWKTIFRHAWNFFLPEKKQKWPDDPGVICCENYADTARAAQIPFMGEMKTQETTPTLCYTWLSHAGKLLSWELIAECSGEKYYIKDGII